MGLRPGEGAADLLRPLLPEEVGWREVVLKTGISSRVYRLSNSPSCTGWEFSPHARVAGWDEGGGIGEGLVGDT